MFDWLFEGRLIVFVLLGVVILMLLGAWVRDRRTVWLLVAGAAALLLGLYFLCDRLVETRDEQINRKLQEMARAVKAKNASSIFQHVSTRFTLGALGKDTFRQAVERVMSQGGIDDLEVWGMSFPDDKGKVVFHAKPKGAWTGAAYYLVRAQFVLDPDGQWRLGSFQVFNPYADSDKPIAIPQLSP